MNLTEAIKLLKTNSFLVEKTDTPYVKICKQLVSRGYDELTVLDMVSKYGYHKLQNAIEKYWGESDIDDFCDTIIDYYENGEITQKYDYRSYENKVINYISHDFGMTYFRENHGLLEYGDVIKAGYENNEDARKIAEQIYSAILKKNHRRKPDSDDYEYKGIGSRLGYPISNDDDEDALHG